MKNQYFDGVGGKHEDFENLDALDPVYSDE
ncbi:hypothetical protein HDC92_002380 [Pedobacter sp. AK017]|nr:hypothetical protein [Pedobacter sp. AK017]